MSGITTKEGALQKLEQYKEYPDNLEVPGLYASFDETVKADREVVESAIHKCHPGWICELYGNFPLEVQQDPELIMKAFDKCSCENIPGLYGQFPLELQQDPELIAKARERLTGLPRRREKLEQFIQKANPGALEEAKKKANSEATLKAEQEAKRKAEEEAAAKAEEERIAAEKKAEEERLAKEAAAKAEEERIAAEKKAVDVVKEACTASEGLARSHRFDTEDLVDIQYVPLVSFVDSPPPSGELLPCSRYILESCAEAMPEVSMLEKSVTEASKITSSRLSDDTIKELLRSCNINGGMLFAIVMYTFDLCLVTSTSLPRSANFYFQLNKYLRERSGKFLKSCHGYLYYLMTGLDRLPPFGEDCVYRGVDAQGAPRVKTTYTAGRRTHWSGFSSSTPADGVGSALDFARQSGEGGLLLRVGLAKGKSRSRDIRKLSAFASENEILLMPNFKCVCVRGVERDATLGIDVIELQEIDSDEVELF